MRVTSRQGQWLGDIAIRESGDMAVIVDMAVRNDISITGDLAPGIELLRSEAVNRRVMTYYEINNIYPATALRRNPGTPGGIGYMSVGITFIVS